ncbi:MAG: hypothetical protein Q7S21_06715 [archaeon]|nr:hypothetical protein [archaeon]
MPIKRPQIKRPSTRPGNAVQRKQKKKQERWRVRRLSIKHVFETIIPSKTKFKKRWKRIGGERGQIDKVIARIKKR